MVNWEQYVGIPYAPHGRDLDGGLDCYGLVRLVLQREFGVDLPAYDEAYADSAEVALLERLLRDQEMPYVEIQPDCVRPGDVLVLTPMRGMVHVGIYIGGNRFLHCNERSTYSTIERLDGLLWRNCVHGIWRHRAMNTEGEHD